MSDPVNPAEVENPVARTAAHEDHENPGVYRGEEADAPRMPTVEEYTASNGGQPPVDPTHFAAADPEGGVE